MTPEYRNLLLALFSLILLASFSLTASAANPLRDELIKAANAKTSGKYVRTGFLEATKQSVNPAASKKAMIIGDSHAQDFFNSVIENNYLSQYQISTRSIPTRCQVYLGKEFSKFIASKDKVFCKDSDSLEKAMPQVKTADLIILIANWTEWSATALPQTIKNMRLNDQQKLFIIGRKSFGKVAIRKYLRFPAEKLKNLRNKPDGRQANISAIMQKTLDKKVYVDLQQLACGAEGTCPVFTKNLKLISFDGSHLTQSGAKHIGQLLFQNSQLKTVR